ncbi:MAG TPA: hypothetical protein VEB21_11475 [Terriglobales bacterium]|nr:hypothetical protein [Terriglobales bacterium]
MRAGILLLAAALASAGCTARSIDDDSEYPTDKDIVAKLHRSEISFAGGDGSSYEQAVVVLGAVGSVEGVLAEYAYLEAREGEPDRWSRVRQTLISRERRMYDIIRVRRADGSERDYHFDASEYYGQ